MNTRSKSVFNIWLYIITAALLLALGGVFWSMFANTANPLLRVFAVCLFMAGVGSFVPAIVEYMHIKENDRKENEKHKRALELKTPEAIEAELFTLQFNAMVDLSREINQMSRAHLATLRDMSPVIIENMANIDSGLRYYTPAMAKDTINRKTELINRRWYLPTQQGISHGSTLQKVRKQITDDLIDCGAAVRPGPTQRAYLVVSKAEAFKRLYERSEAIPELD